MALGTNKIEYEVIEGWEQLPEGWSFVNVAGVATDSQDRVYAFNRGAHPVVVFDRDGKFLNAWGEGVFTNAHGIYIDADDRVYCADNGDHTVRVFTTDGRLLQTLGTEGVTSDSGFKAWEIPVQRGAGPFNQVTNVVKGSNGNLYVADGYGNARVHVFSPAGELLFSWGEPGKGPGEFNLPHAIAADRSGRVYVADRENSRIQVFDLDGSYLAEWTHVDRPDDIYIDADDNVYVAELGFRVGLMPSGFGPPIPAHEPHACVSVLTPDGELQHRFGNPEVCTAGNFFAPHGIWADSRGDLYVAELNGVAAGMKGLTPMNCPALQKFVRIGRS